MKVQLTITLGNDRFGFSKARLETNLDFVPPVGLQFFLRQNCVTEVKKVAYDLATSTLYVDFREEVGNHQQIVDDLIRGGWKNMEVYW